MFEKLPAELLAPILDRISYLDAVRLSTVSPYLHSNVHPEAWPLVDKVQEIRVAERFNRHNLSTHANRFNPYPARITQQTDGHACFSCYKVKAGSAFSKNQTLRSNAKDYSTSRFCLDCGVREGKYRPETTLNVVTQRIWTANQSGYRLEKESITGLLLCKHCNEFSEYQNVGPPEVCPECEEAQIEIDDSEQGKETLEMRKRGYKILQCTGCNGLNELSVGQDYVGCEGCDNAICKKCYGLGSKDCDCEKRDGDTVLSLRRIFSVGTIGFGAKAAGDVFDLDEEEVFGSMKFYG